MHFFVYEWTTGGGMVDEPGSLPASLLREGTTMIESLATDLARIDGARVTVLREPRVLRLVLPRCEIIDVQSAASQRDEFERFSACADGTIVIAPEFDGILIKASRMALASGGNLLSPSPEFVRVAADKHETCRRLDTAGVPVPYGRVLEPDQKLPVDFEYPAVLKPIDGAGSQDTQIIVGPHDEPRAYAWPRRLETFIAGLAASVAVLCGPNGHISLPPCKQRISSDGRLRYLGGELPLASGLAERATILGKRALAALPATRGYVGIDLILGRDPQGGEDFVIEVNPRLTTSYVGLRAASQANLADAMVRVAMGESPDVSFSTRPLEFDVDGNVSFLP